MREAAEGAVQACGAAALRTAQAHVAASRTHAYLHDFDWSLYHVTDSSSLDRVHAPLLQLHLRITKPDGAVKTEIVELKPAELDAVLGQLAAAGEAVREAAGSGGQ